MKNNFKILRGPSLKEQNKAFKNLLPNTILLKAARYGSLKWVKAAIKKGKNLEFDINLALQMSAQRGHLEIIKYLLNNGADIHAGNDAALRCAIAKGYLEIVKLLLNHGANIKFWGDTGLKLAIYNHHWEMVDFLKKFINDQRLSKKIFKKFQSYFNMMLCFFR